MIRLTPVTLVLATLGAIASFPARQAPEGPFDVRLRAGLTAIEKGDEEAAARHLQRALVLRPASLEVLGPLFRNAAASEDARALWAYCWWNAACDERGRLSGGSNLAREVLEVVPGLEALAIARAAAVEELVKLSQRELKSSRKNPEAILTAGWADRLARELARPMPALMKSQLAELDSGPVVGRRQIDAVIKDLKRVHSRATSQGDHSTAVRAARIVRGLAAQGSFDDLQGPVPEGIPALMRWALEALGKSRARLAGDLGEPLSVEQLEEMDEDEAREFSLIHSDQSFPGLAISPRGAYRIETCCGQETLLGTAETVEYHHDRLARWFGEDPFLERQGLVRVVPEAAGLEAEGAGFWWVGGFQGGDTTTLRFSCGTIEGLGHLITHELTHRFDGAIYPGTPAWLAEGKAVWTGGSYGSYHDEEFVEDHINFGTVEGALIKGYGNEQKLRELLTGEIEDYRDNYVAGYALYVYLKLWQDQARRPVFYDRLEPYMRGLKSRSQDPEAWFVANFADGKDGRPGDFSAFAAAFQEFLAGFYWDDRAPWTSRYTPSIEMAGSGWVYDSQTWTWSRSRAEPYWGQDHAWRAGDLLLDMEKEKEAARAYLWAWGVDEHAPRRKSKLASVLESIGAKEAAWVLRNDVILGHLQSAADPVELRPAPFSLPRTEGLLAAILEQRNAMAQAGMPLAAAALVAEYNRLAAWLGMELLHQAVPQLPADFLHPWDEPESLLGIEGWTEDGLTGYEERRVEGCWYSEPDGALHVGRFKPRTDTGILDRRAHNRHAFALTELGQPAGRYAIRCRVKFTTSFASGALILGYGRRDRNIRLAFTAGDFMYSIGKKEEPEELDGVSWRVSGLRDRDGPLSGSVRSGSIGFDSPRSNFELRAIVDGAAVHFWIEDRYLGSYHDALGTPIEGRIGFATGMGAIRVNEPTIQRLDRSQQLGRPLSSGGEEAFRVDAGLDLLAPTPDNFRRLINRPVAGMVPDSTGTILVWASMPEWTEAESDEQQDALLEKVIKYMTNVRTMMWRVGADQPLLLALPDKLSEQRLSKLSSDLTESMEDLSWRSVTYRWQPNPPEEDLMGQHRSWLAFVDSAGVLRHCDRLTALDRSFSPELVHWVTVFRDDDGEN